ADWTVTDLSASVVVRASAPDGSPFSTSPGGKRVFTVSAADPSGNTVKRSVTYFVRYNLTFDEATRIPPFFPGECVEDGDCPSDPVAVPYGQAIHIGVVLVDAIGAPAPVEQSQTLTIVLVTKEGAEEHLEILAVLNLWYDPEASSYAVDLCVEGGYKLEPGLYDLWLGLADGRNLYQRIEIQ
ncbi:MAG: hypothetical protein JSW65_08625, partial [Candidatus Bipolaricaulota bacterium]